MTTAETQEWYDKRVGHLLATRALRRGLSLEPLLGGIDLGPLLALQSCTSCYQTQPEPDMAACGYCGASAAHLQRAISWVITGGESGHDARPTHPQWVRNLRDQCIGANVPFHHKQWGEWMPFPTNTIPFPPETLAEIEALPQNAPMCLVKADGTAVRPYAVVDGPGVQMVRVGKKAAGRLLDGVTWDQFTVSPESSTEVTRG